jgi:Flp pilus assembly protein CpaB
MAVGKKRKSNKLLIIILLIVIVGIALVYLVMTSKGGGTAATNEPNVPTATATSNVELVDIVVASQKIARGTLITADFLTTIKYPKNEVPEGTFFNSIDDAIGTKAKYDIDPGVPLTVSMVIHEDEGSLASFDIPDGMTAFSIAISPETAVAYAPQKGDHVMVVGCMSLVDVDTSFGTILPNKTAVTYPEGSRENENAPASSSMIITSADTSSSQGRYELDTTTDELLYVTPSEEQRGRLVCQTIIQDAEVLRVGFFPLATEEGTTSTEATPIIYATVVDSGTPVGTVYPGSVTLIVSPQDTLILNYLELSGTKLSLALRSAGDNSLITTDAVTLQYVMDQKNIPSPVKLPYATQPRVDTLVYPSFNDYVTTP